MHRLSQLLAILAASLWPLLSQATPDTFGRLFLTPQERQQLDHLRFANRFYTPSLIGAESSLQVQGEMRHRSGRRQRWLNHGEIASHLFPELAVGDHFDPARGQRETLLGNGYIHIHARHPE